jgi:hypothetical protein
VSSNADVFGKYPNRFFVETGSLAGQGIQAALDAGFEKVYSIELAEPLYRRCVARFEGDARVELILGDSAEKLPELIKRLDCPATFWLDGHFSGGETALGSKTSPLMEELRAIGAHSIRTHTILIDDMRCWHEDYEEIGFGERQLRNTILAINPGYVFSYETGTNGIDTFVDDILVARVP